MCPWLLQAHHPRIQSEPRGDSHRRRGAVSLWLGRSRGAPACIRILISRNSFDPFRAVRNGIAAPLRCGGFPGIQGCGSITA